MKKVVIAFLAVGISAAFACAGTLVDFESKVEKEGLEKTVEDAVKAGATAEDIVASGLAMERVNPQNLIKSLYCAGVTGIEIKTAASSFNLSEMIVEAGFKKSVAECSDVVADVQPYTPGTTEGPSFSGRRSGGGIGGNGAYASPSAP